MRRAVTTMFSPTVSVPSSLAAAVASGAGGWSAACWVVSSARLGERRRGESECGGRAKQNGASEIGPYASIFPLQVTTLARPNARLRPVIVMA